MDEGWLERDGVRLHWREWGPAGPVGPPIFCLHGLSSNSLFWARLAQRLPERRLVALDQRSHGLSDRPESGYDFADLVADARHAIAELRLEQPVVLGHSWGAAVALALAAEPESPAAALGHLDGPLQSFSKLMNWDQASRLMQPPLPRYTALEEAIAQSRAYLEDGWDDDLTPFVEAGLVKDAHGFIPTLTAEVRLQILRELFAFEPERLWPRLRKMPVLVAIAERAPEAILEWKQRAAEEVEQLLPEATVRWYPSAHDIPIHLPGEMAAAIRELAASLAEESSREKL